MNHKAVRFVVKYGISTLVAAAIGYMIKSEHTLVEAIEKRWPDKPTTPTP